MPVPVPVVPVWGFGKAVIIGDFETGVKALLKRPERTRTRTREATPSRRKGRSASGTTTRISFAVPRVSFAKTARAPSRLKTTAFLFLPRMK